MGNSTQTTITPPLSHIKDPRTLQPGDHIYRRLQGRSKYLGFHHGIVTHIPSPDQFWIDEILLVELSKENGIQETTLPLFLEGESCRLVYYGANKTSEILHRAGTCHSQPKSPTNVILHRCFQLKDEFESIDNVYSLVGLNCEDFALFCVTGIASANIILTQVKSVMHRIEKGIHCGHKFEQFELCHQEAQHALHHATHTTTHNATHNAVQSHNHVIAQHTLHHARHVAITTGKHACQNIVKLGVCGILFCGVTFGLEILLSGYRYYRYKYAINYLWEDFKMDMITGWTNASLISFVGLILMAAGISFWWLLLPVFGVPALICLFKKVFFKQKGFKEKMFIERGLSVDSTVKEKKSEIKKIKQQILDEKLHPDLFQRENLSKRQQRKRLKKYILLWNIKTLLQEDIDHENGFHPNFEDSPANEKMLCYV